MPPSTIAPFLLNMLENRFASSAVLTGLNYNYFRDYDSVTGRYVESDPIGLLAGVNTYLYVNGSPIKYRDPLGTDLRIENTAAVYGLHEHISGGEDTKRVESRSGAVAIGIGLVCCRPFRLPVPG